MNKTFVRKMIQAERYKYEAIKEILPNELRKKVDEFEKDVFSLLKDIALEMIHEDVEKKVSKEGVKKINIDFNK
ncbi:MAG: hypothetical protein AB2421_18510 [Thermotaleaceae bacterium]